MNEKDRRFRLLLEDFNLTGGDRIAVVGPSGCGKSTLLRGLALLQPFSDLESGLVSFKGENVFDIETLWLPKNNSTLCDARAEYIGYLSSEGGLHTSLSILDNARLRAHLAGYDGQGVDDECRLLCAEFGLSAELLDSPLRFLSRGQKMRGALLKSYIHNPAVLIADEPTSALHPALSEQILDYMFRKTNDSSALIVATHDVDLARNLGFSVLEGHCFEKGNCFSTEFRWQ